MGTFESLKLQFLNLPCPVFVWVAVNEGGKDVLRYDGIMVTNGQIINVLAPLGGWQVGNYPIKVVLTNKSSLWQISCCDKVEVEQLLVEISAPPSPPCCPAPPQPCCELKWYPCWPCTVAVATVAFFLFNLLICDP